MPMFGAPLGIIAAQENNRNALKSGLDAQKAMGDILMQPVEFAGKAAQTRLYNAQASAAEAETAQAAQMALLQQEFLAREQASEQANAQGTTLTMEHMPTSGMLTRSSQADSLEQFANFAQNKVPPMALAKLRGDIAGIKQKEAAAGHNQAREVKERLQAQREHAMQVGQAAGIAAMSPQNYMAIISDPTQRQLLPPGLTGHYGTDLPILRAISAAGQDTLKRLDLDRKLADDANKRQLRGSQMAAASARVDASRAKVLETQARTAKLNKELGGGSPEADEGKKALIESRKIAKLDKQLKTAPYAPATPSAMEDGKIYTHKDGSMFQWKADPSVPIYKGRAIKVNPARLAPVVAGDEEDEDADD